MYIIKFDSLKPKDINKKDYTYIVDIFKKMQADVTDEEIILPDSVLTKIEELKIPEEVYEYFLLVWSNEEKEVEIERVVGSHDWRNINNQTFLNNMINTCDKENLEKYLEDPSKVINKENPLLLFEQNGQYYLADGHHRFSTLFIHYQILKSKNISLANFPTKFPAVVRTIPQNLEFVSRFVSFCLENNLYFADEEGILPQFSMVSPNNGHPKINYDGTDLIIDENTNLEEFLNNLKEAKRNIL